MRQFALVLGLIAGLASPALAQGAPVLTVTWSPVTTDTTGAALLPSGYLIALTPVGKDLNTAGAVATGQKAVAGGASISADASSLIATLASGSTWWIQVRAYTGTAQGTWSDPVTITIPLPPPGTPAKVMGVKATTTLAMEFSSPPAGARLASGPALGASGAAGLGPEVLIRPPGPSPAPKGWEGLREAFLAVLTAKR